MDTLSHFSLSLIGGLAMGLHRKHRFTYIIWLSLLSVLIDLDHFLLLNGVGTEQRPLHNIYVTTLLPLGLFLAAARLEKKTGSIRYQTFFLLMAVMLTGHLIADMIMGPVKIFHPLSDTAVEAPAVDVTVTERNWGVVLPAGIGLAAYAAIILMGAIAHDTIYHRRHGDLTYNEAFRYSIRDYL